jgi:group I intron endonuclease
MHYLYRITDIVNNKIYIGQSNKKTERWRQHKYFARQDEPIQYIHRAMKKYGVDNFIYEVIATCKTQEDADCLEIELIKQYDSQNKECGYNVARGGDHAWNAGLPKDQQPMYGKLHSEESKRKISESNMGKEMPPHTDEWKENMSKIMTDRKIIWVDKIVKTRIANDSYHHSDETKKKMSVSQKGNQAGEKHPRAKLMYIQVELIRKEYATVKITKTALGKKFGVSRTMISNIVKNKNWNA